MIPKQFEHFEKDLTENTYWRFYKVKSVIVKSSDNVWKGIFIVIIPDKAGPTGSKTLLDNDIIKITEEIHPSDTFNSVVSDLFHRQSVEIANTTISTELFIGESYTKIIDRFDSNIYLRSDYPGEVLFLLGIDPSSDIFEGLKVTSDTALLTHEPPFENIQDAIDNLLNINPNIVGYLRDEPIFPKFRPLLLIFNPYPIRFQSAEIIDDKLIFETVISPDVEPDDVSVSVIGRMKQNTIRNLIRFQNIEVPMPIKNTVDLGEEQGIIGLRLIYKNQMRDEIKLTKLGPSIQKPAWFKEIFNRFDPDYATLDTWVSGKGKDPSRAFERGIHILLSLCGLYTIHVGHEYENATQTARRINFNSNPDTPVDVLASPSDNNFLYLIQCSLGSNEIEDKITKLATFTMEVNRWAKYVDKRTLYPVIITNSNSILDELIKSAQEKGIKIVTGDILSKIVLSVRSDATLTKDQIHKLLTIEQNNRTPKFEDNSFLD